MKTYNDEDEGEIRFSDRVVENNYPRLLFNPYNSPKFLEWNTA